MSERWPCTIGADGLIPCHALNDVLEIGGAGTKYQGLKLNSMINMTTHKFSRHLVVLKSGKHSKKGLVLNLCPFCGEELVEGVKEDMKNHIATLAPAERAES